MSARGRSRLNRASEALTAIVESDAWPAVEPIADRRVAVVERLVAGRIAGAHVLDLSDSRDESLGFERLGAVSVTHVSRHADLDPIRRVHGATDVFHLVHYRAEGSLALDSDAVPELTQVAQLLTDGGAMVLTSLAWTNEQSAHSSRTTLRDGRLSWLHGAQVLRWMIETAGLRVLERVDDAGLVSDQPETTRIAWLACRP
jgi:hypothetical protein